MAARIVRAVGTKNAGGRKITVKKNPVRLVDLMRRHLREEGKTIASLAPVWNMKPTSCYRRFFKDKLALAPQHVDAFIEYLRLDEFDAAELRLVGAVEAGWQIDPEFLAIARERAR